MSGPPGRAWSPWGSRCSAPSLNLAFLSAYPVWSAIMIALDILVIYAVTAHGAEGSDDYV